MRNSRAVWAGLEGTEAIFMKTSKPDNGNEASVAKSGPYLRMQGRGEQGPLAGFRAQRKSRANTESGRAGQGGDRGGSEISDAGESPGLRAAIVGRSPA